MALQGQSSPESKGAKFNPNIFRGVVAHITGYTQPSLADLHKMIVTHGGGYLQYLDGKTAATHIIASSLTPKKRVEFRKYRIVKPAWVVDSVKAGKLLPWDGYRAIGGDGVGAGQKVLGRADGGKIVNSSERNGMGNEKGGSWLRRGGGYRDQTDASWYTKQLLHRDASLDALKTDASNEDSAFREDGDNSHKFIAERTSKSNPENLDRSDEERQSIDDFAVSSAVLEGIEDDFYDNKPLQESSIGNAPPADTLGTEDLRGVREAPNEDEYESLNEADLQKEAFLLEQRHSISPYITPTKPKAGPAAIKSPAKEEPAKEIKNRDSLLPGGREDRKDLRLVNVDYRTQYTGENPSPARHFPDGQAAQTAEEHNAIILADPRIRKSTAANPDFLEQYYRESRLHHLSTWKADLKARMQSRAAEQSASQQEKSRQRQSSVLATAKGRRYILHVDFDSFFAAVSLTKHPELQARPAVVAHGQGSGSEIASCNYPARTFGIKNGMWMRAAQDLCPDLHILPYDFPAYEKASEAFYSAILGVEGGIVQSVSIDEALIDITSICVDAGIARVRYLAGNKQSHLLDSQREERERIDAEQAQADDIAHSLRAQIRSDTGCNVSVGIGGNILLAKVALRKAKPAGQYHLKPEHVLDYIGDLSLQDLPGVAWSIGGKLEALIRDGGKGQVETRTTGNDPKKPVTIRDLRELTLPKLTNVLGPKTGTRIYEHARGIDRAAVGSHQQPPRKSVSAEVNWGIRFATQAQADDFIRNLCGEVSRRLTREGVKGKQVTVKMMRRAHDAPLAPPKHLGHGRCDIFSKSVALGVATKDGERIAKEALAIMKGFKCPPGELRGIGVQVTRLESLRASSGGGGSGGAGIRDPDRPESSQKKLQFAKTADQRSTRLDGNADDGGNLGFARKAPAPLPHFSLSPLGPLSQQRKSQKQAKDEDPIEDEPDEPERRKLQAIGSKDDEDTDHDSPARKPLNTLGTQFLMPTQVDPSVLAELPYDVRAKLSRQGENSDKNESLPKNHNKHDDFIDGKSASNDHYKTSSFFPTHSQLDPEVLAALPAEVRSEILSEYQLQRPDEDARSSFKNAASVALSCASPSPSVYASAQATPKFSPLSATTSVSAPKTPSSTPSALPNLLQNVVGQSRSHGRSTIVARPLEGSPSPSPRVARNNNINAIDVLSSKGRLHLLPPLASVSTTSAVSSNSVDAATLARPRSAASNSNSAAGSNASTGIGTGASSSATKGISKTRGSTRGRPRGRPPGIRARPASRSVPSRLDNANGGNGNATSNTNSKNSIRHSYYNNAGDANFATLTLTQANFVPSRRNRARPGIDVRGARLSSGDESGDTDGNTTNDDTLATDTNNENEISPDFLAALPLDIRAEVLRQHHYHQRPVSRLRVMAAAATAPVSANATSNNPKPKVKNNVNRRVLRLPPQPPKPTFSTRHLSEPGDLRAAIKDWYVAFRDEGGPYREDVDALVGYLRRVVGENGTGETVGEGNMAKATSLVRWLEWVVEDGEASAERNQVLSASSLSPPSSSLLSPKSAFTLSSSPAIASAKTTLAATATVTATPLTLSFSSLPSSFLASPPDGTKQQKSPKIDTNSDRRKSSKSSTKSKSWSDANQSHRSGRNSDRIKKSEETGAIDNAKNADDDDARLEAGPVKPPAASLSASASAKSVSKMQPTQTTQREDSDLIIPWPLAVQRVKVGVDEAITRRVFAV